MKKLITAALSLLFVVCVSYTAVAGSLDSPGAPSAGSGMYTLQNLYDYLTSGAALTVQTSFQEPTSGPGSTMKTTKEIGDAIKNKFNLCSATVDNVEQGVTFFCTQPGSWGVQTGTLVALPRPTATQTITATPTITATSTPTPICASCKAIKTAIPTANDGVYTIDPDGAGGSASFDVYCDMTTNGGGWTLVMQASSNCEADLGYFSTNWTTASTLNPTDLTLTADAAKYQSFNTVAMTKVRLNVGAGHAMDPSYAIIHTFPSPDAQTALSAFSPGIPIAAVGFTVADCVSIGLTCQQDCQEPLAGLNRVTSGGVRSIRMGYTTGHPGEGGTLAGIGLSGSDCCGSTCPHACVGSDDCRSGNEHANAGWLWVQ